jgi:selenocysteine lyase/cysteine desulfurase
MPNKPLDFAFLRSQIVGIDSSFPTPFGERLMLYCDYTASGRALAFVEHYLMQLQRIYANTHTEDDVTGRSMSLLLRQAETTIKDAVNAGPDGRIIACGAGSTEAINKFQQIIGVALPPATRALLFEILAGTSGLTTHAELDAHLEEQRPVIFVGPYEHHSNEITWREGVAEVREVRLAPDGGVDLEHLETLLRLPEYRGRLRIGSFSAASNVTGMKTPVAAIASLLHNHDALACFDFAAAAPYSRIDMNPTTSDGDGDPSLDAVFISPHKFLGGPGSAGVLVFNQRIYRRELAPSVAGGGTVLYVGPQGHDFAEDIEEREKAGTPGVLQTLKASLAFEVKEAVGVDRIEAREQELLRRALDRWSHNPGIEILGNPDPARRIGVVSFNVKPPAGAYLHPKLVTVLLNDLFGIQSRAGCSCAGPYGHRLLGIDTDESERYRNWIQRGYCGIKPGWCRIGFHYTMDNEEADFVVAAVEFLARCGHHFLPLYCFDVKSGAWTHCNDPVMERAFSLDAALEAEQVVPRALPVDVRRRLYSSFLEDAEREATELAAVSRAPRHLEGELRKLQYFVL